MLTTQYLHRSLDREREGEVKKKKKEHGLIYHYFAQKQRQQCKEAYIKHPKNKTTRM